MSLVEFRQRPIAKSGLHVQDANSASVFIVDSNFLVGILGGNGDVKRSGQTGILVKCKPGEL